MNTPDQTPSIVATVTTEVIPQGVMNSTLEKLALYRSAFEAAQARHAALTDQVTTQEKAAQAAEAEALVAKQQLREELRGCAGRPSKKLYGLKAQERSAYSLAEEYRCFGRDIAIERDRSEIEMHAAANGYRLEYHRAIDALADQLIDSGFANLPPELIAGMHLKAKAQGISRYSEWSQVPGVDSPADYVLNRVHVRLRELFEKDVSDFAGLLPAELASPVAIGTYGMSPLGTNKLRNELKAREEQELGQEIGQ